MRVLVAGCGDLGLRAAKCLHQARADVFGLRRTWNNPPAWLNAIEGDLISDKGLGKAGSEFDAIIYSPTPGERTPDAYRRIFVDGLGNILSQVACGRLVFVSSTAVYGQDAGEWVDESSETIPAGFNGEIMLQAEQLAQRHANTCAVRLSGIYGPGRTRLIDRSLSNDQKATLANRWTNRIHVDDAAKLLAWLVQQPQCPATMLGTDGAPAPLFDVINFIRAQRGRVPLPEENIGSESVAGKRCKSTLLTQAGFEFSYPDYQHGYHALLA